MRLYTIHLRRHGLDPQGDLDVVKEGFCWPAFLFSVLWALWHRLWLIAIVLAAAEVLVAGALAGLGADAATQAVVSLGLALIVGFVANDARCWTLNRRDFVETTVVTGHDGDAALARFLEGEPALAAELSR